MNISKLAISILICLGVGFLGSVFTTPSIDTWYAALNKPSFSPPNWMFAPVWTILFIMMGVSLYLVWDIRKKNTKKALYLFGVQLSLNLLWSLLFFGLRNPLLASAEIIILWVVILLTIMEFRKFSKTAAYLLIPYIIWVSFAAVLNFTIVFINYLL
ncbi:MAG: tryptophan-rich sensory protein [Candidatus Aenigmarchaeota archaeon]|nr:tryptophan-rich sensory protein [Candidatus Aenigmarchaeota archaeon]